MVGTNSRELNILITARDRASEALKGLRGNLEKMRPAFKKMATYGTIATGAISAGIYNTVQSAGRAEDIERLYRVAFDNTEDRMDDFVDNFTSEFGRATTDVRKMTSDMAFTITMGTEMSEEAMADLTEESVLVAEALAFAYDHVEDGTQAMSAITRAYNGSNQALQQLVPTIREGAIEEKAMEMGLIDTGEELDRTNRAAALHQLILEGTTGSVEALMEAEGSYADAKARLNATIKETTEELGVVFLPLVNDLLQRIEPVVKQISGWIKENEQLVKWITLGALAVSGLTMALGLLGLAILTISPAIAAISAPVLAVIGAIGLLIAIGVKLYQNWDAIANHPIVQSVWDLIKPAIDMVKDAFSMLWDTLKELFATFKDLWEEIKGPVMTVLEYLGMFIGGILLGVILIIIGILIILIHTIERGVHLLDIIFTTIVDYIKMVGETIQMVIDAWRNEWDMFHKAIIDIISSMGEWVRNIWNGVMNWFTDRIKDLQNAFQAMGEFIGGIFGSVNEGIKSGFKSMVNWVIGKINWLIRQSNRVQDGLNRVPGVNIPRLSTIPMLAKGGIVTKPTLAMVGEAGPEAVVPLDKGYGGGVNITINGDVTGDEIIEKVKRGIMGDLRMNSQISL